jgi:hypothetical protein
VSATPSAASVLRHPFRYPRRSKSARVFLGAAVHLKVLGVGSLPPPKMMVIGLAFVSMPLWNGAQLGACKAMETYRRITQWPAGFGFWSS